jgi:hypothetical protein
MIHEDTADGLNPVGSIRAATIAKLICLREAEGTPKKKTSAIAERFVIRVFRPLRLFGAKIAAAASTPLTAALR